MIPEAAERTPTLPPIPTDLSVDKSVRACLPPGRRVTAPTQAGAA